MCKNNIFIGFIKVGYKHLFIYDESSSIHEINPLCVLDFYTYEKCQRQGYGKIIFSEMIKRERIEPRKLGYDRPSIKFKNFLNKYFNLYSYIPQTNNFIVFQDYFLDEPKKKDRYDIYSSSERNYNYNNNFYNNYGKDLHNEQMVYDSYYNKNSNYKENNDIEYNKYEQYKYEPKQKEEKEGNKYDEKEQMENNLNKKSGIYQDTYSASYRNPREYKEYYSDLKNLDNNNKDKQSSYHNTYYNNNNYNQYASYLSSSKIPFPSYQYRKTSSEYGSFFNYKK